MGSERESVKCPIWRGLERLRPAAGCRLARQSLYSEPQIQRWRPVLWGRTFHASRRSWKESSHPIDSSWVGIPARLIAGTLGGTGIAHRVPWLGRSVPTKAAGIPWLPNGENPSIPRRLKNPECCHQTRPLSPETLRPGRPSLAPQSTRTKPFKPEPNERTSLYSLLRRADFRSLAVICRTGHGANQRDCRIASVGIGSRLTAGIGHRRQSSVSGRRALQKWRPRMLSLPQCGQPAVSPRRYPGARPHQSLFQTWPGGVELSAGNALLSGHDALVCVPSAHR